MSHWAVKYIGLKHVPGGRGAEGVDCWGLVRLVYRDEFQIELPMLPGVSQSSILSIAGAISSHVERDWEEVYRPFDGCTVAMSQHKVIHHVGLFAEADGGKIIHCWDKQNVIADTVRGIAFKGFQVIKFYRHKLWHTSLRSPTLSIPPPHVNIGHAPGSLFAVGSGSSILGLLNSPLLLSAS